MVAGYDHSIRLRAIAETNQTNVPLKLTIASGMGEDTADTIHLQDLALNWPYDVRFTNEDGDELDFWREEYDAEDGTWWVLIDSLTAKEISYFYLYYGKSSDSDASSTPETVGVFYDGFETGDFSKWNTADSAWSVQGTTKYEGSYAAYGQGAATSQRNLSVAAAQHEVYVFEIKARDHILPLVITTAASKLLNAIEMVGGYFRWHDGDKLPTEPAYSVGTWYSLKVTIDFPNQTISWEIDGAYIGSEALTDHYGNPVASDDYITVFGSKVNLSVGINGYIDNFKSYPIDYVKWLSPETEEALEDGLYVVERRIDYSLKPEETMRSMAYNDHAIEFTVTHPVRFSPMSAGYTLWEGLLQDDAKHGISAHYTDGEVWCEFNNTETDTGKTIIDVTVAAFVSGRARTTLNYGGSAYYGTLSTKKHVAAWLETVYTTIPGTTDPWTFSALGVFPMAGVDLRKTSSTEFPIIYNTEGTALDPPASMGEWETDPSMYVLDSTCYCIKILIHYYLNSDPSNVLELELLPEYVVSVEARLAAVHQNIINNGDVYGSPMFCVIADTCEMPVSSYYVLSRFQSEYLEYLSGGSVKISISVGDYVAAITGNYNWQWRVFIEINGTRYYSSYQVGASSGIAESWDINPATGLAWAEGDLDTSDGVGVEINNRYVCSPPTHYWLYPTVSGVYPIISKSGTDYYNSYGALECTPGLWRVVGAAIANEYEYYLNDLRYCNLIGDMYMYDGTTISTDELNRRFESDLSEIPPSYSQINGFDVTASVFAWSDDTVNTYWRIFISVDGTRYYSDEYTTAGHPKLAKTETYSWDVNPATSAAWTYDELQGVTYGLEVTRSDKYDLVIFRPYELYADITYQAIKGPLDPIYHKLPVIDYTIQLVKYSNTPKFKADELRCVLPVGYYQPERTEIVLAKDGAHVFHGFIWQADQRPNKETQILAKAQSHALACRYIPNFFYHARNSRWMSVYSLDEVFSDAVPVYPNEYGWMAYCANDGEYERWINIEGYWDNPVLDYSTKHPLIYQLWGTYSNVGIFFLLNSMIPYGYAGDTDRYQDVAEISYNRAKFLMSHNPSNIPKVENLGCCLLDSNRVYWGWNGCDPEVVYTISDDDPTNMSDPVGGIKRFRQGAAETLFYDEYAYSGNDLLVSHNPGAFMVLFDHALDTYLRPGSFELEDKYLAVPYLFNGSYANAFSDFFFRLGQEVWFRNAANGFVYMDSASELGRAATLQFLDGKNSTVTKSIRDPPPACVLGNEFQPRISTDWMPARTWLTKIEYTQRTGDDLQEWIDLLWDEDKSTWTVKTQDKLWHIMPGDYVLAQARGQGLEDVRVRKAIITNTGTALTCGKRLYDLSEEWGQWRSVKGSTDADTDMPVQEQEIDLGDADGSQTFTIKAEEYEIGSWKCKLSVSWDLDVDEGYTADLASAPLGMFLVIQVNGKVVPPGRIQARGNSGSTEIDITEFCTCSTESDEVNTVAIKLWRGVTATNWRHTISGSITQYRRLEAVDNA